MSERSPSLELYMTPYFADMMNLTTVHGIQENHSVIDALMAHVRTHFPVPSTMPQRPSELAYVLQYTHRDTLFHRDPNARSHYLHAHVLGPDFNPNHPDNRYGYVRREQILKLGKPIVEITCPKPRPDFARSLAIGLISTARQLEGKSPFVSYTKEFSEEIAFVSGINKDARLRHPFRIVTPWSRHNR